MKRQVSILGPVCTLRLGKLANFVGARPIIAVLCLAVLGPQSACAQELNATDAMGIYRTVDTWVRNLEVGDQSTHALSCVSVTLRIDGQVIGRGQIINPDADPMTAANASRSAIAQSRAWVRKQFDQEPTDELWSSLASRLTVSVELVDRVVPMSDAELALPGLGLSPGVHGLVMRLGEQTEIMTPDEMATLGMGIEKAAYAMATGLSGDGAMALASVGELIKRGYSFGRCTPVWIAQGGTGKGGVFLDRGGRIVEESSVGARSVRQMGERIAEYLLVQRWPGSERYGMVGTRDIVSGRALPQVAPVYEQAIVATALLRFSQAGSKKVHAQSHDEALRLLRDLGSVQPGEPSPWGIESGIDAAACVIALSYLDEGKIAENEDLQRLQSNCQESLAELYSSIDGYSTKVPAGARGLVAWALVRGENANASAAVRAVFRDTPQGLIVGQMPFLGWAELDLAAGAGAIPASGALTQMRSRMWDHQLGKSDLDLHDRDFTGAVVFTKGATGLPTSGNIRPIAMICTMLGDPRLTPGTVADPGMGSEIRKSAAAMRFVDQLMMTESSGFLSKAPDRCIGGVRSSLWEWKVSPASSAIALLAAVEFERSVKAIQTRAIPTQQP